MGKRDSGRSRRPNFPLPPSETRMVCPALDESTVTVMDADFGTYRFEAIGFESVEEAVTVNEPDPVPVLTVFPDTLALVVPVTELVTL